MKIVKILQSTQEELLAKLPNELRKNNYKKIHIDQNCIYAEGEIPILLVAHMDVVHKKIPELIIHDANQKILYSPTGIGGDDRCGIIAILEIVKRGYKPHIIFTSDEEIGGVGIYNYLNVNSEKLKNYNLKFAIEIDRRGNNQAVFYECDNKKFQDMILNDYGFDLNYGTYTDIRDISNILDIASVNLSAGYYNEHTLQEYIKLNDLSNTIEKICKILDDNEKLEYYKHEPKLIGYDFNYLYDYGCNKYTKKEKYNFWEEEDFEKMCPKEWFDWYGYEKPKNHEELMKIIEDTYKDLKDYD